MIETKDLLWERLQVRKTIQVQFIDKLALDTDITLNLYDPSQFLGHPGFTEKLMAKLENLIKTKESFHVEQILKKVKLSTGRILEGNFSFLMAKSLKRNLDFGILFNKTQSSVYQIVGLWPRDFLEVSREDPDIFKFFLYRLINTPNFFVNVRLFLPVPGGTPDTSIQYPTQEVIPPSPEQPVTVPFQTTSVDVNMVIQTKRCPHCKAKLPDARLQVLQRGNNTFCNKCYNIIIKGVSPSSSEIKTSDTKQLNLPRFLESFINSLQNPQFLLESALLYVIFSLDLMNIEMRKVYNKNMTEIEKRKDEILRIRNTILSSDDTTSTRVQFKLPAYTEAIYPLIETHLQDLIGYGLLMIMEWLELNNPLISQLRSIHERVFNQVRQNLPS